MHIKGNKYQEILNSSECPKQFCFLWLEKGNQYAPGLHENLEEALKQVELVTESKCGCWFGICKRLDKINGKADFFEPCETEFGKEALF